MKKIIIICLLILIIINIYFYYIENFEFNIFLSENEYDIYLFTSSMFTHDIYTFKNILKKKGNIIYINYPSKNFDIENFTNNIKDKIIKNKNKTILIGYSFGSLICNIINSKIKNNNILKKIILISNSCDGIVTNKAMDIYKNLSKIKSLNEKKDLINQLLFPINYEINKNIQNKINKNQLSNEIQQNISIAIGKWMVNKKKLCKNNNNVKISIIHGKQDIVYALNNKNNNIIKVENAGHGIIFQKPKLINNFINKELNKI